MRSHVLEHSEDRKRGRMAHLAQAMESIRSMRSATCSRCGRPASHRADWHLQFCATCADFWRSMSPLARLEARHRGLR